MLSLSDTSGIPDKVKGTVVSGAGIYREFATEDEGAFPYPVNLHMALGAENAGRTAYLYRYDAASKSMKAVGSFSITKSGQAMFGMNCGGRYLVTVPNGVTGTAADKAGVYTVAKGDNLSRIAVKHSIGLKALLNVNPQIKDANRIYPGQEIQIPVN